MTKLGDFSVDIGDGNLSGSFQIQGKSPESQTFGIGAVGIDITSNNSFGTKGQQFQVTVEFLGVAVRVQDSGDDVTVLVGPGVIEGVGRLAIVSACEIALGP